MATVSQRMKIGDTGIASRSESKAQRFERIAERRVVAALDRLRLVGNLANRHNYEYTEEHARQIIDAIEAEMRRVKQLFRQKEAGEEPRFSFRKRNTEQ
jgi:hypothetical protein